MLQIVSQAILSLIRLTLQKLSRFFSYLSAGFQICDVVWAMDDFCSQNVSPWLLYLVIFFSKVRLFSTLVKNQSSETAVQNSRTFHVVRLFLHLEKKSKKSIFFQNQFFQVSLHSTLYTIHSTLGRVWQSQKYGCFFKLKKN